MANEKSDNVWTALADSEEDATNMTMRSDLMTSIEKTVAGWRLPQAETARRLGLTRPRLNDLLPGRFSKSGPDALAAIAQSDLSNLFRGRLRGFSIERLLAMLTAFGRDVEVVVRPGAKAGKKGGMKFRRAAA